MKTLALAVTAILYATAPAHADVNTVITFDNINAGATHVLVGDPTGYYNGLFFTNFYAEKGAGDHVGIDGYANGVVSNPNAVYIDGASGPGLIFAPGFFDPPTLVRGFGSAFTLNSAYLTSTASNSNGSATHSTVSYVDVTGVDASFNGDCGGTLPACLFAHVAINDYTPTLVNFGWNVVGVIFAPVAPAATTADPSPVPFDLVIDNLSVVPEPGAVFLFGAVGLALLPLIRRRFRQV